MRNGEIAFLHKHGYSSFAFDYRATGESSGLHCTIGDFERLDLRAAISETQIDLKARW
jgi:alpha/beta superfamily hydrolase